MNKKIALTGATGFVGGHLLNALKAYGYTINALTRRPQTQCDNVNWISGDLKDKTALKALIKDTDVIINVAGLVKAKSIDDFKEANTHAISSLLSEIHNQENPPHFIQISSITAREPHLSDYAASKHQGEKFIMDDENVSKWTIIRPPGIYGPNDDETLKIFRMLKLRLALYPGNRHNRVSWIYVHDLVSAILKLMENEHFYGKTIEIDDGSDNGYSHQDFFDISSKIMNIKPIGISVPKFILKTAGHTNDIFGRILGYAPMVSAKKINELCHADWVCHNEDTNNIKGWQAEYDLNRGLLATLDWYKNNGYL